MPKNTHPYMYTYTHSHMYMYTHTHTHTRMQVCTLYLVPGAEYSSWEHEQVTHGDQASPYKQREEAEQPLEHRLNADKDEDGQEEEERSGNRDQERQVVLCVLERETGRESWWVCWSSTEAYWFTYILISLPLVMGYSEGKCSTLPQCFRPESFFPQSL